MSKQIELRRKEIAKLNSGINGLLAEKDSKFKLNKRLIQNKHSIRPVAEELEETGKRFNKDKDVLLVEYCKKDKDGKPVVEGNEYAGLKPGQCPEFDEEMEKLSVEMDSYIKEKVKVVIYPIDESWLPKSGCGVFIEGIAPIIKDFDPDEELEDTED